VSATIVDRAGEVIDGAGPSKMVHAALTISLKRSTKNLQLSTTAPADYGI